MIRYFFRYPEPYFCVLTPTEIPCYIRIEFFPSIAEDCKVETTTESSSTPTSTTEHETVSVYSSSTISVTDSAKFYTPTVFDVTVTPLGMTGCNCPSCDSSYSLYVYLTFVVTLLSFFFILGMCYRVHCRQ